ncbi:hypothetical protein PQG76_06630 [Corynebacterium falsenii]|uniref:hypothetical protein n=1 Tax=Corynebacterium falsenii TaxID=108486 RepID=UPI00234C5452|nr:hypothetical protein [Corynebacterium falsenii]MDC7104177.1 hypothetical protein [Corynebacterium falsenii]
MGINRQTVVNAWREMGRNVDDPAIEQELSEFCDKLLEKASDRATDYYFQMEEKFLETHTAEEWMQFADPDNAVTHAARATIRSNQQAIEEIMDEYVHQPLYDYQRRTNPDPTTDPDNDI